jgi:UDP-3-O-[3-hydroxymyristoyl] N-acetylglucosamine deacetylase
MSRRTLAGSIAADGIALHAGSLVHMTLAPAPPGTGVLFRRSDLGVDIPARHDAVTETNLGTVLASGSARVGVVEHLMAAVAGAGIDDLLVTLDGPEPPILDGDALSYLELLERAGFADQPGERTGIKVMKRVACAHGNSSAALMPSDRLEYDFEIDFPTPAIGRQSYALVFSPETFRSEIAPARTFGFVHELDALKAIDRGHGASLANTLAVADDRIVNEDLIRFPGSEFVRHKILDAVGDMALAGAPLIARFEGRRSGHTQNNALLRALFADPSNYARVNLPQ